MEPGRVFRLDEVEQELSLSLLQPCGIKLRRRGTRPHDRDDGGPQRGVGGVGSGDQLEERAVERQRAARGFDEVLLLNHRLVAYGKPGEVFRAEHIRTAFGGQALTIDGVIVVDARERVADLNPAAQTVLGTRVSRAVGLPIAVENEVMSVTATTSYEYASKFFPWTASWFPPTAKRLPPVITAYMHYYTETARALCGAQDEALRVFADYLTQMIRREDA